MSARNRGPLVLAGLLLGAGREDRPPGADCACPTRRTDSGCTAGRGWRSRAFAQCGIP